MDTRATPLQDDEFARLMAAVGPFESAPHIAVAVSGGADSLALALLCDRWVRARRGRATALTVDHGLRPDSAAEARRVGRWLRRRGIAHRILRWRSPPRSAAGAGGIQAAARAARYRLLAAWCQENAVLHLALAHQQEDQAETLLLRLARGSGLDGLAGMAAVSERQAVRLIRPMLPIGRSRLEATLAAHRQPWIDDPTNRNPAHARVRVRRLLPELAEAGLTAPRLAAAARHLGRARAALDDEVAALLATATVHPAGYLLLDPHVLAAAPLETSLRALARCLLMVGGGGYTPRLHRLEALHAAIVAAKPFAGRTLAGCRVQRFADRLLVCRELAAIAGPVAIAAGSVRWDERFEVAVRRPGRRRLLIGALGLDGWIGLKKIAPAVADSAIPPPVRPTLPALWQGEKLLAVPHLHYRAGGSRAEHLGFAVQFRLAPMMTLAHARFTVA